MDKTLDEPLNSAENEIFNSSLRLVAKSSFIVFFGIIFSKLITFVYRIIIAKNLGPEPYGLFSLAFIISSIFIAISCFGLHDGVLRYVSFYRGKEEKDKINYLFKFSMSFIMVTSVIAAILLFLFSDIIALYIFKSEPLSVFLKWFSIIIPLSALSGIFISCILAFEKIVWQSFLRNILQPLVQISALIILIFFSVKNEAVIFSYLLSVLTLFLGSLLYCKYKLSFLFEKNTKNKEIKKQVKSELFSYSWPLVFLSLIMFIFSWFDSLSIGYFLGVSEVGVYNAAVPIAALLSVTPTIFLQLLLPLITKEFARKNNKVIKNLTKQVAKWIFIFNLPALIIMILFPGAIINLLGFGSDYLSAQNALRFLGIGMFFYSVFIISENLLSMAGKSKTVLTNIFLSSMVNLVLNIILVPRLGIEGAAISNMSTYIFWSIMTMFQAKRCVSIIPLKRKMITIALVSIIPTVVLLLVRSVIPLNKITLILEGILFLLIYFLLIFLTGCLDKNDIMIFDTIKNKIGFKNKKLSR